MLSVPVHGHHEYDYGKNDTMISNCSSSILLIDQHHGEQHDERVLLVHICSAIDNPHTRLIAVASPYAIVAKELTNRTDQHSIQHIVRSSSF